MSRLVGLVATAVLMVLAGCSDGTPTPGATSTAPVPDRAPSAPQGDATSAPATTSPSKSASKTVIPGAKCLSGTWRLVRFTSHGGGFNYGTGRGGDLTMTFDKGGYTLVGNGKKPIRVKRAGESADLRIDGTVKGTQTPDGKVMSFTIDDATGDATLESGGHRRTLPVASIAEMVAPSGRATLACPRNVLTITLPSVRLDLQR
ncbi:MAG TPA: hypothetical protein VNT24_06010 [Propionibacteriaceae bacterium]|nr:hypothetical protein [Propionibacteriaceae bacterium]